MKDERGRLHIGEFGLRSGMAPSALRYYDEVGVLRPVRVDSWTGYRLYAPEQLPLAVLIRELRALAMPIAEVRVLLAGGVLDAHRRLDEHWRDVEARLARARSQLASVHRLIDRMEGLMGTTVTIDADALRSAIDQVLPAAPVAPHRLPAGILLHVRGNGLRLVATDGHRLALRDLVPIAVAGGDSSRVVPGSALADLAARLAGVAGSTYDLSLDELPELAEEFPDYGRVLRIHTPFHSLAATGTELRHRLEAAEPVVRLTEFVPPMLMALDRDLLLTAVQAVSGPDVMLESAGPLSPLVVRSPDDPGFMAVVMPIRLKEHAPA